MEIVRIINKLRALSICSRREKDRINVFVSIPPSSKGGGSNTFAYNLRKWLLKKKDIYHPVYNILKADKAIVIADKADLRVLEKAKRKNCLIIHRLDEHVERDEDGYRKRKHAYIREINSLSDITVYQSRFVFDNMHPFLGSPGKYEIILNGADPGDFYPAEEPGGYIGHVTWGVGDKKRIDIVYDTIKKYPDEQFLLIGNHSRSDFDFASLPNVRCVGQVSRHDMLPLLHQMKFLFFPSANDPCPNTVIESILSGVPVCYNPVGGTKEIVRDCGLPITEVDVILKDYPRLRQKCLTRQDLDFNAVADRYMNLN